MRHGESDHLRRFANHPFRRLPVNYDLAHRRNQNASVLLVNVWCGPDSLNGDEVPAICLRHEISRMDSAFKDALERKLLTNVSLWVPQDFADRFRLTTERRLNHEQ
jgi:hypothetical protein